MIRVVGGDVYVVVCMLHTLTDGLLPGKVDMREFVIVYCCQNVSNEFINACFICC